MLFGKIHHVAIICSNYERSLHFYNKILGLNIVNEVYRNDRDSYKVDLAVNENMYIELFSFPKSPRRLSYPEACGLRHLSFGVSNLDEAIDYLKTRNVECGDIRIDEITGKRFTFFKDPDDLPLEIYEE